ncbi:MAG TPA: pseudouridine synthase [Chitinophagaceae bacterium]|nr:pseudouridine synthase [Chitinophagaceae bacterium]
MKKKTPSQFSKFAGKKNNAAIKEQFKQEKRKWKKEREAFFDKKRTESNEARGRKPETGTNKAASGYPASQPKPPGTELMPLNKFIAHAGICGRREAADMVKAGKVKVNNELVAEPGHRVSAKDEVRVNGKKIFLARDLVYILLNKPKDYITTTDDPQNRKTVLDLVRRATSERVYPVGRLDRNTSGVLLLTNDGELAQQLTHPKHEVKKIYAVTLDKPLDKKDFDRILKGVNLEDGLASVDVLAYADIKDKTQLGVEIHSGRNRIVRRIFEHLGYDVKNLDRVSFAGLTKKNIERGKWRFLSEKEVRDLKHFSKGK